MSENRAPSEQRMDEVLIHRLRELVTIYLEYCKTSTLEDHEWHELAEVRRRWIKIKPGEWPTYDVIPERLLGPCT